MKSNLHKDDANELVVELQTRLDEATVRLEDIRGLIENHINLSCGEMLRRIQEVLER